MTYSDRLNNLTRRLCAHAFLGPRKGLQRFWYASKQIGKRSIKNWRTTVPVILGILGSYGGYKYAQYLHSHGFGERWLDMYLTGVGFVWSWGISRKIFYKYFPPETYSS